jgi:hypothetical protein
MHTLISDTGLTTEEITRAARHLSVTRACLLESISGLTTAQLDFKPDRDTWSIAEILEHLVIIETRIHAIIANIGNAPEAESSEKQMDMDWIVLNEVPRRSIKVKAPTALCPANRWSCDEAVQGFNAGREKTMQLLAAPLLRGRVLPHPVYGPWDGYQWLLAVGSHTARHTDQIRERKADRNFPQTEP